MEYGIRKEMDIAFPSISLLIVLSYVIVFEKDQAARVQGKLLRLGMYACPVNCVFSSLVEVYNEK